MLQAPTLNNTPGMNSVTSLLCPKYYKELSLQRNPHHNHHHRTDGSHVTIYKVHLCRIIQKHGVRKNLVFATRFTVPWHLLSAKTVMSRMMLEPDTSRIQVKSLTAFSQPAPYLRIFLLRQKCERFNETLYTHNCHPSLLNGYWRL
jgi:hypothetical protein